MTDMRRDLSSARRRLAFSLFSPSDRGLAGIWQETLFPPLFSGLAEEKETVFFVFLDYDSCVPHSQKSPPLLLPRMCTARESLPGLS